MAAPVADRPVSLAEPAGRWVLLATVLGSGIAFLDTTVVNVALPFSLFAFGEQRVSSVLAGIWNAANPLVALPLAVLVFRTERMTARRAAGIGLGFLGVLVVLVVRQGDDPLELGWIHIAGGALTAAMAGGGWPW